jgi:hypothetical protein
MGLAIKLSAFFMAAIDTLKPTLQSREIELDSVLREIIGLDRPDLNENDSEWTTLYGNYYSRFNNDNEGKKTYILAAAISYSDDLRAKKLNNDTSASQVALGLQ